MKNAFQNLGYHCISSNLEQNKENYSVDLIGDFMQLDYQAYINQPPQLIFAAIPCQAFSKASGGKHFKNGVPQTPIAHKSLNMLDKIKDLTLQWDCGLVIENPAGGLCNNPYFQKHLPLQFNRVPQGQYGFKTPKYTDIFSNFPLLIMSNPIYRVNGRISDIKLENMSYRQKTTFPVTFCKLLAKAINNQFLQPNFN